MVEGINERSNERCNERFMDLAVDEAIEGSKTQCGGPFGCTVTKLVNPEALWDSTAAVSSSAFKPPVEEIVGAGHNCVLRDRDCSAHGEMQAIRAACRHLRTTDLSQCYLYTTCTPCPMCWGACHRARIRAVFTGADTKCASKYGFDDGVFYDFVRRKAGAASPMLSVYYGALRDAVTEHLKLAPGFRHRVLLGGGPMQAALKTLPPLPPLGEPEKENSVEIQNFMKAALMEARKSTRLPFGTVIVKDGEIIGTGVDTCEETHDVTATAEINALRMAMQRVKSNSIAGAHVYTLVGPDPMSLAAILWSRATTLHYAVSADEAAALGFTESYQQTQELLREEDDSSERAIPMVHGVLQRECEEVFAIWKRVNGTIY